jgi:predicted transcriptional regulator
MASRTLLSVRIDKPAAKERLVERLQAIAESRGCSLTSLALQALREFLAREEGKTPNQEEVTSRLLNSTTSLLSTITSSLEDVKGRVGVLENLLNAFNESIVVEHARVDAILGAVMGLIKESHSEWPQEQLDGLKRLLSPSHPKLPLSLFKGKGADGAQG